VTGKLSALSISRQLLAISLRAGWERAIDGIRAISAPLCRDEIHELLNGRIGPVTGGFDFGGRLGGFLRPLMK